MSSADAQLVLLVDDQEDSREMYRYFLEFCGFRTVEAGDGHAALEAVRTHSPDVIVSDLLLPILSGFDLAERLTDWDERVLLWKFHHFQLVQRVIGGHVIGTQGTPVEVLGKRLLHLYPFLWEARDKLTELASHTDTPQGPTPGHGR